jgi:C4-dicarboxylate-specific signal transduction histidine kinase
MMGELSGALAHELNQPLTAILANAEAARRMLTKGQLAEIAEVLDDIVNDDNRASEVIRRLHRLLKKGDHKSELIDFNDLVTSTLRIIHSQLISRRIRVKLELATSLPPAFGDAIQLQQVFLNVIMNAIEAMTKTVPTRRVLKIETRLMQGGFVQAAISDQGPGLTEEQQRRLFEPFFTTKDHGLGLGLPICSTIMTSHGGQISIASSSGEGTTALISIPIGANSARAEAV